MCITFFICKGNDMSKTNEVFLDAIIRYRKNKSTKEYLLHDIKHKHWHIHRQMPLIIKYMETKSRENS